MSLFLSSGSNSMTSVSYQGSLDRIFLASEVLTKEQLVNSSMAAMLNARAFRLLFTGLLIPMILFFIIS